jgi:Family of unknown function (DUF6282)
MTHAALEIENIENILDLHVHAGPDVRARKLTALETARAAHAAGWRGFVFKNHHAPTVIPAALLAETVSGLIVRGGLALNESVGGLNPAAVDAALRMGAAQIWLPTLDAAHERAFRGLPGGLRALDERGRLVDAMQEILRLIAAHDCILGLGHLSRDEIKAVVQAGRELGIGKLLVNHPEINFMNLPVAAQRELAAPGVWFERCYVRANQAVDWDGLAAVIRAVGVASSVLATDLGQPDNPDPIAGMNEMLMELSQRGFTRAELQTMACVNPARLLGLN